MSPVPITTLFRWLAENNASLGEGRFLTGEQPPGPGEKYGETYPLLYLEWGWPVTVTYDNTQDPMRVEHRIAWWLLDRKTESKDKTEQDLIPERLDNALRIAMEVVAQLRLIASGKDKNGKACPVPSLWKGFARFKVTGHNGIAAVNSMADRTTGYRFETTLTFDVDAAPCRADAYPDACFDWCAV